MLKKSVIFTSAVLLVSAGAFFGKNESSALNASTFIVQGASTEAIAKYVEEVGGKTIHAHTLIDALTVELTSSQKQNMMAANPLLRFFKDSAVEVNGFMNVAASGKLEYSSSKNTIKWGLVNLTANEIYIESVKVMYPPENGLLTEAKLGNKKVKMNGSKSTQVIEHGSGYTNITLLKKEPIKVKAQKDIGITLEFDSLTSQLNSDYEIVVSLSDGEEIVLSPGQDEQTTAQADAQTTNAQIIYKPDNAQVEVNSINIASSKMELEKISINWPTQNNGITKLEVNGNKIYDQDQLSTNELFYVNEAVNIKRNDSISVKVEFDELYSVTDSDYSFTLYFTDGSAQTLAASQKVSLVVDAPNTFYPSVVNADMAHNRDITGAGVTVAIIDTGINQFEYLSEGVESDERQIYTHTITFDENTEELIDPIEDVNGHGSHIASIIGNSGKVEGYTSSVKSYKGIAPDADMLIVKAFNKYGEASYSEILQAIEYVVDNKDALNIKVLNLSFSATPTSYYWDDPINLAVMRAWQAGIFVVAAVGNKGPEAMTVGVPGNNPYILTTGAVSDNYTPGNVSDDFVTRFSSAGPTIEGFPKPEIVAPGGHIQGLMHEKSYIVDTYGIYTRAADDTGIEDSENEWSDESYHEKYFALSGSSQSTAIISGVAALMLQNDPSLSPDDIKCKLMVTARLAVNDNDELAFSIFQQGSGLVDAIAAIDSEVSGCGNTGLDINKELHEDANFVGPVQYDEDTGEFFIPNIPELNWNGAYTSAQLWGNTRFMSNAQLWGNTRFMSDAQLWGNTRFMSDAQLWGNTRFMSDSQLWGNARMRSDSQLWGNRTFESSAQLWGNRNIFNASTIETSSDLDAMFGSDTNMFNINWVAQE